MKLNRAIIGVFGTFAVIAALPVRAEDKPVKLARIFKKDEVTRHKSESVVSVNGMEVTLTQSSKITIKEVKDDGHVLSETKNEGGKINVGGMEMDIPEAPPVTVTKDKRGVVTEFKMDDGGMSPFSPEILKLMVIVGDPILSEKEVKAGDSWETELDNPAVKGKKFTIKTTFVGVDKVDGVDLWKVKQTTEPAVDAAGAKMGCELIVWLAPANGREVKSESSIKDLPSNFGTMSLKSKTTLVKEEKK